MVREVCFLQEDSSPLGMHRAEQEQLWALAEARRVARHVSIHCGTDEYASAMAGRLAAQQAQPEGTVLRLYVEWLAGDKQFTAEYEDRAFVQNLDAYLETCRIQRVISLKDAQAILAIYAPEDGQRDLAIAPEKAICTYTPERLDQILRRLRALLDTGIPVGLLDIYFAGGGEGCLLRLAAQQGLLLRLAAYAGWNTASNSLGTILGQLLAGALPERDAVWIASLKSACWTIGSIRQSCAPSGTKNCGLPVWMSGIFRTSMLPTRGYSS